MNELSKMNTSTIEGFILDDFAKTIISPLLTPTRNHFAVVSEGFGFLAEAFKKRSRKGIKTHILVENKGFDKPDHVTVKALDGRVFILDRALNFDPQAGACVQLLLGIEWTHVDDRARYHNEKIEANETRWI